MGRDRSGARKLADSHFARYRIRHLVRLNHRDAIDCDVPAVLDALAGSRGAIALNSDPQRLDLPPEWIPAARERKIPFVISVDAHSTRGLGVLRYGLLMARRGGVLRTEVLNTEPAHRFAALVRPTQAGCP